MNKIKTPFEKDVENYKALKNKQIEQSNNWLDIQAKMVAVSKIIQVSSIPSTGVNIIYLEKKEGK